MFTITNDGQNITSTNYWDSDHARAGYMFITINAGCVRLLVPESRSTDLKDMEVAKKIIIERGQWPQQNNRDTILITFDDNSELPYIVFIVAEQCDRLIPDDNTTIDFAVWTQDGLFKKWDKCEYKRVETL